MKIKINCEPVEPGYRREATSLVKDRRCNSSIYLPILERLRKRKAVGSLC